MSSSELFFTPPYYRKYIKDYSTIARPLNRLTEKDTASVWGDSEKRAWSTLKEKLVTSPIFAYPDPSLPFILDTYASYIGIGAVLSQVQNGHECVIT